MPYLSMQVCGFYLMYPPAARSLSSWSGKPDTPTVWREPVPNHENGFSPISGIDALVGFR